MVSQPAIPNSPNQVGHDPAEHILAPWHSEQPSPGSLTIQSADTCRQVLHRHRGKPAKPTLNCWLLARDPQS